jgi:predicted metal-dependent enzyme (double-stranded beta helix superfamily)
MAQATSLYTLDRFIADIRNVFALTKDPCAQAQGVAGHMQRFLAVPGCLDERVHLSSEGGFGRINLYLDEAYGHPDPGFLVMCALLPPSRQATKSLTRGTPHDHGASWVVYGVYQGAIEQTTYRWFHPEGQRTAPVLTESERFVQDVGEIAFFLPGEIHKTATIGDHPAGALRVEAQAMDRVVRHRYNPETNTAEMFQAAGR